MTLPLPCRRAGSTTATFLLAHQVVASAQPGQKVLELGCGCGDGILHVVSQRPDLQVDGVERQDVLATIARHRLEEAHFAGRSTILTGNVCHPTTLPGENSYHHLFCNPPFRRAEAGRLPVDSLRAAARFELHGGVKEFICCAKHMLTAAGTLHMIHLPERESEITGLLEQLDFNNIQAQTLAGGGKRSAVWVLFHATLAETCKRAIIA